MWVRDIFEAAERQSATLAMYVEHMAKQRGWSARTVSGMLVEPRLMMVYSVNVMLPYGRAASFLPAQAPRVDGDTWNITIKRSDGVSRPPWNLGIAIRKLKGEYVLTSNGGILDEGTLAQILDSVAQP